MAATKCNSRSSNYLCCIEDGKCAFTKEGYLSPLDLCRYALHG